MSTFSASIARATACALFLLLFGSLARATDYYLGSQANSQPGIALSDLADLNSRVLAPGDHVWLQAGESFTGNLYLGPEDAGSPSNPITISSFGAGVATILAGDRSAITIYNASGFQISRLNLVGSGPTTNNSNGIDAGVYLPGSTKLPYLRFDDMTVSGFNNGIEIWAWYSTSTRAWPGFTDVQLNNLNVFGNRSEGIKTWGTWKQDGDGTQFSHENFKIAHCTVFDNHGDPAATWHTGSGIIVSGVDGATVEYCVAHDNGGLGPSTGGGPFGIWAWEARGVTLQYNLVYRQKTSSSLDGGAYDLDGGCSNCILQYNYSYQNDGPAIGIIQFQDASPLVNSIVRYNISENDCRKTTQGIIYVGEFSEPYGISGADIYANTVFVSPNVTGGKPPVVSVQNNDDIAGVRLRNNLFIATHSGSLVTGVTTNPAKALFQGNDYWGGVFDLAAFRIGGQETLNGAPTGSRVDPQLPGAGTGGAITDAALLPTITGYLLSSSSPAATSGVNLAALAIDRGSHDFFGVPISSDSCNVGASSASIAPPEPPPSIATVLVDDQFDGTGRLGGRVPDTVSPAGRTWALLIGNASVANGVATATTTLRAVIDAGAANCTVEAPVTLTTADTGLLLRCSSSQNYLRVVICTGSLQLKQTAAGVSKTLGTKSVAFVLGQTYQLRAVLTDATISISVNGVQLATFNTPFNQTATRHGLICSNTGVRSWERFTVTQ